MSFTSYQYDVFISYAHADDIPDASGKGWVEQFQDELRKVLPSRLHGNIPTIFFDRTDVASTHQLSKLRAAARNSAIFLAITSPNYAARPWTREELAAFTASNDWNDAEDTRLCAVECLEPEDRDSYPSPLNTHIAMQFWETHGPIAMPLRPRQDDYFIKLTMVASDIAKKLKQIRDAPPANPAAASSGAQAGATGPAGPAVLLAQATDDLEEACEQVRTYLAQFKVAVLPAEAYPQGGEMFRAAFAKDLARASLFVQLLSASPGRRPPDMPEGYTAFQAAAARAKGIPTMQWRSPELKLASIANAEYRKLLAGENVIADSLESFKATVVRNVTKPPEAPRPPPSFSKLIFIDASLEDLEVARQIESALAPPTALPKLSGPTEAIRKDLEDNIVDCDVLLVVNNEADPFNWVRGQLRRYIKLRSRREAPARVVEVVLEPPENKEDLGMRIEELKRVRVRGPLDREALRPVIEAIAE